MIRSNSPVAPGKCQVRLPPVNTKSGCPRKILVVAADFQQQPKSGRTAASSNSQSLVAQFLPATARSLVAQRLPATANI